MRDVLQVQTTLGSEDDAARIGRALVDARLAACAQVLGPIRSVYRWAGSVHDEAEWLLLLKARAEDFDALAAELARLHPYDEPEILGLPARASDGYGDWVRAETRRDGV